MPRILISYISLQAKKEICGKFKTQQRLLTTGQQKQQKQQIPLQMLH